MRDSNHSVLQELFNPVHPPDLEWIGQYTPFNKQVGDIYFSVDGGIEETFHTFMDGNRLKQRFAGLENAWDVFSIGELGFGTGLNFLTTAEYFLEHAPKGRLLFFSVERAPLRRSDALRLYNPIRSRFKSALIDQLFGDASQLWPGNSPGFHSLSLAGGRIQLCLMLGDGLTLLRQIQGQMDAWFLDGFAPRKNPDLWSEDIFNQLARLSKPGATFATYSVSSSVKEGLIKAGFEIERVKGFGKKKHALRGTFNGQSHQDLKQQSKRKHITLVGTGLAATELAVSLIDKGAQVVFVESPFESPASANPLALAMPTFAKQFSPQHGIVAWAFIHAMRVHSERMKWPDANEVYGPKSVLKFPKDNFDEFLRALEWMPFSEEHIRRVSAEEAFRSSLGFQNVPAIEIHSSVSVRLPQYLSLLHKKYLIKTVPNLKDGLHGADAVVFANGSELAEYYPDRLTKLRGQVAHWGQGPSDVPANGRGDSPSIPLSKESYFLRDSGENHCRTYVGATYERGDFSHSPNLQKLSYLWQRFAPLSQAFPSVDEVQSWVGFRTTTRDYLPIIGEESDRVTKLRNKKLGLEFPSGKTYVFGGLGSKGLLFSVYGAEILSSMLLDQLLPCPRVVAERFSPTRWEF